MDRSAERSALKGTQSTASQMEVLREVYQCIQDGARSFLRAEYSICLQFVVAFSVMIIVLIGWGQGLPVGILTMISFVLGAITSMVCGYIGMHVAVFSNARTTINCMKEGYKDGFNTAFRAGAVMGFALTGLGIFVFYITMCGYR